MLTAEALAFVASLEREFGPERKRLVAARQTRQAPAWAAPFGGCAGFVGAVG